jgi:hypothetical protein
VKSVKYEELQTAIKCNLHVLIPEIRKTFVFSSFSLVVERAIKSQLHFVFGFGFGFAHNFIRQAE